MAEIIEFQDVVQARVRRRERALTTRCLELMEEALAGAYRAHGDAISHDRFVWAHKIRQLEELIAYTTCLADSA